MYAHNLGRFGSAAAGCLAWLAGWLFILFNGSLSQASHALLLVLASALAALVWRPLAVIAASTLSVAAFDWMLIAPRGRFAVDVREDAILLTTMLSVACIIALLLGQLKKIAARALAHAERAEQQRSFAEALRAQSEIAPMLRLLQASLVALFKADCAIHFAQGDTACKAGAPGPNQAAALALCAREGQELGTGTGRYADFPGWVAPLRAGARVCGAVLVELGERTAHPTAREHALALLTLFATVLERHQAQEAALRARAEEQAQLVRNALLASIAHDHRTPLATILGAASSLADQHDRLDPARRIELARTIVLEVEHLNRLTDNTLRLAKLDSPHLVIQEDWQSAEEGIGTVVQRARRRYPGARFEVSVRPELPLFRADGVLIDQLLDNLVDNAVRHGAPAGPVEISAGVADGRMVFEVADRGPGIPEALAAQVFEPFQGGGTRGAGLGLAICRAIARVHRGEIGCEARPGGGALMRMTLPLPAQQLAGLTEE